LKSLVRRLLPTRVKPHRIVAGPLRGARIVTSWHDYPASIIGRTERGLLGWFDRHVKPGETWLDVGAHYGYTVIALSQLVGPSGRVFAFEPVVSTAGCVAQTGKLNGLTQATVVPCGLGAPESLAYLKLPLERGMADQTLSSDEDRRWESIQIARLDWFWPLLNDGIDAIDGVKIDVQGMEIDALRGMEGVLRRQHPKLVIELHAGVDRSRVLDLLARAGYQTRASAIDPRVSGYLEDNHSYAFMANDSHPLPTGR
jgi:FkbM family methyltransferase